MREARALGHFTGDDEEVEAIREACGEVPVTDGDLLTDVLQEWLPLPSTRMRALVK